MSYQAMKRHGRDLSPYYQLKEANPKKKKSRYCMISTMAFWKRLKKMRKIKD